jgi:hypothetical protein
VFCKLFVLYGEKQMRSKCLKMSVALVFVLGMIAGNNWAKDSNKAAVSSKSEKKIDKSSSVSKSKPAAKDYKGTIKVTKNKEGKVETVDLKAGSVIKSTYHIVLDEKGKELAAKFSGKKVVATATLEKKKSAKWLTVTKYSEVKKKEKKESKKSNTETKKETDKK